MMDADSLLSLPPRIINHSYTRRDTMLYALGVGAGQDGSDGDLQFVYEDGLRALPTMAAVLGYPGFWQKEPEYGIDWAQVLHVEQSVTFHLPLPIEGKVRGELHIDQIIDKGIGKGALLYATRRVFAASTNRLLATVRQVSLLRGDGGCGGSPSIGSVTPYNIPKRHPDIVATAAVRPEQALLYRLSGDYNPVHADPIVAKCAGFPGPVMHGLATYGIAGRLVLRLLCDNDPVRLKHLSCRFVAPVFPGDAIEIEIWRDGPAQAAFRVRAGRRGVVLDNGFAELEMI